MTAQDPLPARMLNEFTYCPRLAYLEWVQGEWADNVDTLTGEFVHRNADTPDKQAIPTPKPDDPPDETLHARSVRLEDATLGLVAVVDVLEVEGATATPIDYKKGFAPDLPEGAWEPERVQLCAQGLLLRAAGFTCTAPYRHTCEMSFSRTSANFSSLRSTTIRSIFLPSRAPGSRTCRGIVSGRGASSRRGLTAAGGPPTGSSSPSSSPTSSSCAPRLSSRCVSSGRQMPTSEHRGHFGLSTSGNGI